MTRPSARHVLPEFTERTSSGPGSTDPYAKLLEERILFLGTPLDDTAANDLTSRFMYLEHKDPGQDIALYINSPGGSFSAMTVLYDTMRYLSCDVRTTCLGQAAATAAVLLAAGTPGKRSALPGARVVIRRPALAEPVRGQASDLAVRAEELTRNRRLVEEMPARATGHSREKIGADIERDRVFDARQAVDYGLVDRIVPGRRASFVPPAGR
ncbi:ATP-dependent Clp protease proteolytic subunit [Streptomyces sp. H51]|uniref:ATP-dependent Clp protease proteolytic subunit n=1 Tax=Streptomyces sp. H51 TaxID=3111770 RepID=UPI002D777CA7|nr:ATP-dependent Clp protease proteolytic subunit [Streptomyces sp. H51]